MTTSTILQYNGVRLQNVQTLSFSETPINNDSGQYLYTHTHLKVLGYITLHDGLHLGTNPNLSIDSVAQGASQQFGVIKHYLEAPRRRLIYSTLSTGSPTGTDGPIPDVDTMIGNPLFIIEPAREDMYDPGDDTFDISVKTDVQGGPTPKNVSVTHIANNMVWRVEFTVEFHTVSPCVATYSYIDTADGEALVPDRPLEDQVDLPLPTTWTATQRKLGILSNRWSCQDHIDENGYTTRTYTGNVMLSNPNWNPNDFRAITIPPMVAGMMRSSIEYVTSEDNLSIRYTVTDKEVTVTAPVPARTMKIVHNEALTSMGAVCDFSIRVMLSGDRLTPLFSLMLLAYAIVDQRLYITDSPTAVLVHRNEVTTEQGTDSNHLVTLVVSGKRFPVTKNDVGRQIGELAAHSQRSLSMRPVRSAVYPELMNYNNVLSYGNRAGEQPVTEGSIPALSAIHARLTSPCSTNFDIPSHVYNTDNADRTRIQTSLENASATWAENVSLEINDNRAGAPIDLTYSADHKTNLYIHYNITSTYGRKNLNVALPISYTNYYQNYSSNVVVQIGPPQPTRRIRIEAERIGYPPKLPGALQTFTETGLNVSYGGEVTNTLVNATATHLNPAPVADGSNMIYTSYLELEYLQNKDAAYHRFGIPAYINVYDSGDPYTVDSAVTNKNNYSYPLASLFVPGALNGYANADT